MASAQAGNIYPPSLIFPITMPRMIAKNAHKGSMDLLLEQASVFFVLQESGLTKPIKPSPRLAHLVRQAQSRRNTVARTKQSAKFAILGPSPISYGQIAFLVTQENT